MDIDSLLCYTRRHETSRKPCATGETPPQSHPVALSGHDRGGCGCRSKVLHKLGGPVATSLSETRSFGPRPKEAWGTTAQAILPAETEARRSSARGSRGFWLFHQSLDNSPGGRSDSEEIRHPLSSQPYLARLDRTGLELPEAGKTGPGEGRSGDCGVAEEALAGGKKKLACLGPIWRSWMKAGLCSFRRYAGPGHCGVRRLLSVISTGGTGSRPFRRLRSLPGAGITGCTSRSRRGISRPGMWPFSSESFCGIFEAMWSCCGTRRSSIEANRCKESGSVSKGFMSSASPSMLPSSTPRSMSGPRRRDAQPTALLVASKNSGLRCLKQSARSEVRSGCSSLASGLLSFRGNEKVLSIIFA